MNAKQTALQLINAATQKQSKLAKARLWLVSKLLDGPQWSHDVLKAGLEAGFSETTIKRASRGLINKAHSRAYGGTWMWGLNEQIDSVGVNEMRELIVKKLLEATQ